MAYSRQDRPGARWHHHGACLFFLLWRLKKSSLAEYQSTVWTAASLEKLIEKGGIRGFVGWSVVNVHQLCKNPNLYRTQNTLFSRKISRTSRSSGAEWWGVKTQSFGGQTREIHSASSTVFWSEKQIRCVKLHYICKNIVSRQSASWKPAHTEP